MRVCGISINGHDTVLASHPFFFEPARDELLDVVFSCRFVGANVARDLGERFQDDAVQLVGRFDVRLLLRWCPDSFKPLDQFGARDDFHAEGMDKLDRAGIHARHVGDVVHR